jgi:hypothetical protein
MRVAVELREPQEELLDGSIAGMDDMRPMETVVNRPEASSCAEASDSGLLLEYADLMPAIG